MAKITLLTICVFIYGNLRSQLPKIDSDRPDQTESSYIVPKGFVQAELGFVYAQTKGTPAIIWTVPTLLTKFGLSKNWELRLITEYEKWGDGNYSYRDTAGFLPVQAGFKVNLLEEKKWLPRISFIFHSSFNRLASRKSEDQHASFAGVNFRFTFQNSLSPKVGLGYNLGIEWNDLHGPAAIVYTLSPGFDLSEKWYCYIELFGEFSKGDRAQHAIDGGIAYYISPHLKIDASAGFGIFNSNPDHYLSVGLSFRSRVKN
jgi:hypothetical protein